MRIRSVLCLLSILAASQSHAATFDGRWKVIWPCAGSTGIYAERCSAGERDYFALDLWSNGDRVCGVHAATAQLGNRIDEDESRNPPSIVGRIEKILAKVEFRSAWGGTGHATIRVEGDKLYWKVTHQDDGDSWIPKEAVLLRLKTSMGESSPDGVKRHPGCPVHISSTPGAVLPAALLS